METPELPPGIRELPVVGGDLALDFANTVDDPLGPERHDHVAGYHGLLWWSVRVGVLTEPDADRLLRRSARRRTEPIVREAHQLRTAINLAAGSLADSGAGTAAPTGGASVGARGLPGWDELRWIAGQAVQESELVQLRPVWAFETLESPLWPVASAAYELLTGPRALRIKRCAGCPWLFLDQSKNGSRRWCSMEICGTNEKMRRYVSKRAARRAQT